MGVRGTILFNDSVFASSGSCGSDGGDDDGTCRGARDGDDFCEEEERDDWDVSDAAEDERVSAMPRLCNREEGAEGGAEGVAELGDVKAESDFGFEMSSEFV